VCASSTRASAARPAAGSVRRLAGTSAPHLAEAGDRVERDS
jgi:hypothetical protein